MPSHSRELYMRSSCTRAIFICVAAMQGQLQLAPQQEHAMRAVYDTLHGSVAQLLAERRGLLDRLQVLSRDLSHIKMP